MHDQNNNPVDDDNVIELGVSLAIPKQRVSLTQTEEMKLVIAEAIENGLDKDDYENALGQVSEAPLLLAKAIKAKAFDLGYVIEKESQVILAGRDRGILLVEVIPNHALAVNANATCRVEFLSTVHHTSDVETNKPHCGSINVEIDRGDNPKSGFRIDFKRGGPEVRLRREGKLIKWEISKEKLDKHENIYTVLLKLAEKYLNLSVDEFLATLPSSYANS